jgi:beta-lactamase class A
LRRQHRQPYARHGLPWQHRTRLGANPGLRLGAAGVVVLLVALAGLGVAFGYAAPRIQPLAALPTGPVGAAVSVALRQTGSEAAPATDQTGPAAPDGGLPVLRLQRPWTADPGEGVVYDPELASRLDAALAGVDGRVAVAVKDLASGRGAVLDDGREVPAASLFKLPVLYAVFQADLPFSQELLITDEVKSWDLGTLELGVGETLSVAEALERMITISDNSSAILLANAVGPNRLNADMAALQLDRTHYSADRLTTSAGDMLDLLERIAQGTAVSRAASADMVHLLLRQRVNDRLPRLLPDEAHVAHKTGNLPGVVNDVGVVYGPHSTFVVAGLISDTTDEAGAVDGLARLAQTTYAYIEAQPEWDDRPRIPAPPNRLIPPTWRQPRPPPIPTPTSAAAARPEPTGPAPTSTPEAPTPTGVASAVALRAAGATPRAAATAPPAPTSRPAAAVPATATPVVTTSAPAPTGPPTPAPRPATSAQVSPPTPTPRAGSNPPAARTPGPQATGTPAAR